MKKRTIALLALICTLFSFVLSCSENAKSTEPEENNAENEIVADPENTTDERQIPDNLEPRDFGGKEFVI
ncbi:MAG: hypothetical protein FWH48_07620, partial [Oscillospiraceae bacterium]|nr:hypothetical protein [Oscillospiraceae bacterium]